MPAWLRGYRREWLAADVVAGLIVWSVVTPQAVAYAQIAGLPPEAGLMAAPGAMIAYAWLGTSRSLIVSATTATSALSASAVGPLADGDATRFAALSAALALVTAATLAAAGALRLGGLSDFVSKPVMTGFLFGLGLIIMAAQLPALLGVADPGGAFFPRVAELLGDLGSAHAATLAVGAASVAALVALRRFAPRLPGTLIVLAATIAAAALLDLEREGVGLVGDLPRALPDPALPDVALADLAALLPAALGVVVVTTEAVGVARSLASRHGYDVDPNRELTAMGGANLLAGLSSGFVQAGGASQTAAADAAGGRTPLTAVVAAVLVLLTGAFLAPLFSELPNATLAAIVVVAVAGFLRADELRRFAGIRRSALVFALIALAGVLLLGVLPGLLIAAALSLGFVVQRISRPRVAALARDPVSGRWGDAERNPTYTQADGSLVVGSQGQLFYANASTLKDRVHALVRDARPRVVVLELAESAELDVGTIDALTELAGELERGGVDLRLAAARRPALRVLERAGLGDRVAGSIEEALNR